MNDYDAIEGASREHLCRFLAACYYQPDPAFAEERMFVSMLEAACRIAPPFAARVDRLGEAFAAEGQESLLIDYARLFLGPPRPLAVPYGSVWLDGERTVMGDSTMNVQELYAEGGFGIADDFLEAPDHVAAELEFLYLLIYRENEAQRNVDGAALAANGALRRRFLRDHLGRWVGAFTASVSAAARCAFYRELAGLTDRFVTVEAGRAGAQ